ncbi:Lrp/AsnC family transcriptional regulator [Vogesella indigofera]|uniref:Lrp/AsnC family transcriptional regulator n=1 Tax=Vogesella indigofera TaxID=45465 RepID=UPI00234E4693|nr:Lrp/AsnC family transcriptional regulator [Vogesella indigofera]MDC7701343.1 Lrp/AsnC family transcriptional regulator [Vogesella indigofera]
MLDAYDRKLLALLQEDARQTHDQLAEAVNLSPTAVTRRLKRLRSEGIIQREVALVDPALFGRTLRLVVNVMLQRAQAPLVDAFKAAMEAAPEVMECYNVTGRPDFVLMVLVRDMGDYERFARAHLMNNPHVREFESLVVINTCKYSTAVPADPG